MQGHLREQAGILPNPGPGTLKAQLSDLVKVHPVTGSLDPNCVCLHFQGRFQREWEGKQSKM